MVTLFGLWLPLLVAGSVFVEKIFAWPGLGSVLAERFAYFVGHPPMLYLTRWRMQLAASRLAAGAAPVSAVASEVGYESEAAFCRAFKKVTGVTPAAWRSRQLADSRPGLSHHRVTGSLLSQG